MIFNNLKHRFKLFLNNYHLARKYDILIEKAVTIKYWHSISVGKKCTLQSGAYLYGSRSGKQIVIGDYIVISSGCMVFGEGGLVLGDYTHLGPNVVITTQYGDSASEMCAEQPKLKYLEVKIGKGCWIGSGSVIMPGTRLGDSCIVAPNSVVYGIWGNQVKLMGNPARKIKLGLTQKRHM